MREISKPKISKYTTYKLAGEIEKIYFPENILELKELLKKLKKENKPYKILGNGSNLIISSKYDGVLIKLQKFDKLNIEENTVIVGAGYMLSKLAYVCAQNGLQGLEFAFGIPATVGGAVYQNAGAYGKQMDKVIKEVKALDEDGKIITLTPKDLGFGYRQSIFKKRNMICLEVTFKLEKGDINQIKEKINEYTLTRKNKQPLEYPSAGSVFRNPEGKSAGQLIEKAGLKGYRVGDAIVSKKHANFILNVGNASSDDVIKLIKIIQDKVKEETGILLELEQEILE